MINIACLKQCFTLKSRTCFGTFFADKNIFFYPTFSFIIINQIIINKSFIYKIIMDHQSLRLTAHTFLIFTFFIHPYRSYLYASERFFLLKCHIVPSAKTPNSAKKIKAKWLVPVTLVT